MVETVTFGTAEEFWGVYQHMKRPTSLPPTAAFYLFRKGEAPSQSPVGTERLEIRLKQNGRTNRIWEDLQLLLLASDDRFKKVRGVSVHSLTGSTLIELSLKSQSHTEIDSFIVYLKDALELGNDAVIERKGSVRKDSSDSTELVRDVRTEGGLKRLSVNEQAKFEGLSLLRENKQLRFLIEDIDKGE